MKHVDIYTDGACRGNPGNGGWGAVLVYGTREKELSGGERETTNNRMELTAAIESLALLKESCEVTLYSDSKYLCDAINLGWARGWKAKGWVKADKKKGTAHRPFPTFFNSPRWWGGHSGKRGGFPRWSPGCAGGFPGETRPCGE